MKAKKIKKKIGFRIKCLRCGQETPYESNYPPKLLLEITGNIVFVPPDSENVDIEISCRYCKNKIKL